LSIHEVRVFNVEKNVFINGENVPIRGHYDLIVGHFWLITGVRDRTVEEEVLIDGVRDGDEEDKLSTMTATGGISPSLNPRSSCRPEALRLLRVRLIAVLHRGIDVRLLQPARGLCGYQLVQTRRAASRPWKPRSRRPAVRPPLPP
jgi:hypothetical protein